MKAPRVILLAGIGAVLASSVAGCQDPGRVKVQNWPPRTVANIDMIWLRLTPPAPVNWDDKPGSDGLQVQVNFFQIDEQLSVTVKGSLEFALYEGYVRPENLAAARPVHTWPFSGVQLASFCGKSAAGWGYAMRLPWGDKPPAGSIATLIARYTSPDGNVKVSDPLYPPLGQQ
jgi:hypothetical protein